jgi:hypothetical protein
MMDLHEGRISQQDQRIDKWEFRLLLSLAMACFFVVSVLTRLLPRSLRPFAAPASRRESCFEEARRMAWAVIPYAFEW